MFVDNLFFLASEGKLIEIGFESDKKTTTLICALQSRIKVILVIVSKSITQNVKIDIEQNRRDMYAL